MTSSVNGESGDNMVDYLPNYPSSSLPIFTTVYSHHERLKNAASRLYTFKHFPATHVTASQLAEAGFFYLHTGDLVECAFCGVQVGRWEEGDDPITEHWRWSPSCPFLQSLKSVTETDVIKSKEVIGRPDFSDYSARMETFKEWPPGIKQTPEELCAAGFFYTGVGDKVICFSCGVGAHAWEEGDEPMKEHAKMSKNCNYLVEKLGRDYITEVNQSEPFEDTEEVNSEPVEGIEELKAKSSSENCVTGIPENDPDVCCKICYDKSRCIILLPCHHMCTCLECSVKLERCPICREPFESFIKAILE